LATLYKKTAQGELVCPTKPFGLAWPLRYALMLVNGKRTGDELRALISAHGDEALHSLLESGFIEEVATDTTGAAAAQPRLEVAARDLVQTKRLAVRWLADRLGPYADPVNLKIERAKTSDELLRALQTGHGFVTVQLGAAVAREFDENIVAPLQP
jgi:hypothetical protein